MMRWVIEYEYREDDEIPLHMMEQWARMAPGIMGPPINKLRCVSVKQSLSAKSQEKPADQNERKV